ncbi:substrate-binding domain-containing protein [Halobacterium bonnevillei]|uniref:ABC transporter substrate-binding protein n=1 Tax=Halobacterium bonnevillei TaxID=2692200 RepID=A0A6B0SNY7_9EURY|nr:ABC transporter substrate-binding protein [Halobacterium bonnevillei]MXR19339.1 ABC transporter substrate-binding protein [Halobacterium bonnevillei]
MHRRSFLKASGSGAALGLLAGCIGGDDGSSGPITIAALEPISGPFSAWGQVHRAGLRFALDEVNEDGGVLDRDLELDVTDTGADPGEADSAFRRSVEQENAVVTTGAVSSDVGIRVGQTAEELEVPHFLHMSGADEVISESTRHVFRVGLLPASSYIRAQASAFEAADYSQVGAIVGDYAWGQSARSAINEFFDADVNVEVAPVGADDFKSYIRQMPDDLEMMIASGHPPGSATIANQLFELDYAPDVVTGASTPPQLLSNVLSDDALNAYTHVHQSDPYTDAFAETASAFADSEGAQFNTHTAYGYMTGKLIAAAIEEAGEADPTSLADTVRDMEFDTLSAAPLQYSETGELDNAVVAYSNLVKESPSYYSDGNYSYEELFRSDPVPARQPGE